MIADRRALLRERLASAGLRGTADAEGIPRRADPAQARLSAAQRHTWRYQRAHPGSLANNLGLLLTFTGTVDADAVAAALARVAARHDILRTTYHVGADGQPFQRVHDALPFPVSIARADADEAETLAQSAVRTPFDLESNAPLRLALFRTAPDQVVAALVVHHILWDGATFDVLSKELERAYAAPSPALPELLLQYGDVAEWEHGRRERITARDLEYWTRRLAPPRPRQTLPLSRGDAGAPVEAGGRVDRRLTASAALLHLAARNRVTPFVAFIACWAAVLGQNGADEVTIGTTVLTRDRPGTETLIGNLANHIVLRLPVGPSPASTTLVAAAAAEFDAAFNHRHLPYEDVAEALGGQDLRAPPHLFDTLVVFIPGGTAGPRLPGAQTRWRRLHNDAAQFPLVPLGLEAFVRGRGGETTIDVEATFARTAFDAETVRTLLLRLDETIHEAAREAW